MHPQKDQLRASDVFVYPDLQFIEEKEKPTINAEILVNLGGVYQKCIIFGGPLSGKTLLAKRLQRDIHEKGLVPIHLNAADIKYADDQKFLTILKIALKKQYKLDEQDLESCAQGLFLKNERVLLIVDDFHQLGIRNPANRESLLAMLDAHFKNIYIFADASIEMETLARNETRKTYESYELFRIKPFGYVLRDKLIEKWAIAGNPEAVDEEGFFSKKDELSTKLEVVIGKNFMTAHPLQILTILQLLETGGQDQLQGSSYAELYRCLINMALGQAKVKPDEIDFYHTYLSFLAFRLYSVGQRHIDVSSMPSQYESYCKSMGLSNQFDAVHARLVNAKILKIEFDQYSFNQTYYYYFFVAKYLSDNFENPETAEEINRITKGLFKNDNANILLFLIHHTKNSAIISGVIKEAQVLFEDEKPISLTKEELVDFNDLIREELKIFIDDKDPNEHRLRTLELRDHAENAKQPSENKKSDQYEEPIDLLGRVTLSLKVIEILGQISKNHYGSLNAARKIELVSNLHTLGFRALSALLRDFKEYEFAIRKEIEKLIEDEGLVTDFDKGNLAKKIVFGSAEILVMALVKKMGDSLASKHLFITSEEVAVTIDTPAAKLTNIAVKLNFQSQLDIKEILKFDNDLVGNHMAKRVLRFLIVDYLYKFKITYSERQRLCDKLGIKINAVGLLKEKSG